MPYNFPTSLPPYLPLSKINSMDILQNVYSPGSIVDSRQHIVFQHNNVGFKRFAASNPALPVLTTFRTDMVSNTSTSQKIDSDIFCGNNLATTVVNSEDQIVLFYPCMSNRLQTCWNYIDIEDMLDCNAKWNSKSLFNRNLFISNLPSPALSNRFYDDTLLIRMKDCFLLKKSITEPSLTDESSCVIDFPDLQAISLNHHLKNRVFCITSCGLLSEFHIIHRKMQQITALTGEDQWISLNPASHPCLINCSNKFSCYRVDSRTPCHNVVFHVDDMRMHSVGCIRSCENDCISPHKLIFALDYNLVVVDHRIPRKILYQTVLDVLRPVNMLHSQPISSSESICLVSDGNESLMYKLRSHDGLLLGYETPIRMCTFAEIPLLRSAIDADIRKLVIETSNWKDTKCVGFSTVIKGNNMAFIQLLENGLFTIQHFRIGAGEKDYTWSAGPGQSENTKFASSNFKQELRAFFEHLECMRDKRPKVLKNSTSQAAKEQRAAKLSEIAATIISEFHSAGVSEKMSCEVPSADGTYVDKLREAITCSMKCSGEVVEKFKELIVSENLSSTDKLDDFVSGIVMPWKEIVSDAMDDKP